MGRDLEKRRLYNRHYFTNTIWNCPICIDHKCSRGARWAHIKTKKHQARLDDYIIAGMEVPPMSKAVGRPKKSSNDHEHK